MEFQSEQGYSPDPSSFPSQNGLGSRLVEAKEQW